MTGRTHIPMPPLLSAQSGSILDRLLGLHQLSWSDPSASIGLEYALPAWLWALIVIGVVLFGGLTYRRLLGPRMARILLALLRSATILIIALLLAGPTLILPRETIEQDWLLIMLDRSASMQTQDVVDEATGNAISRDEDLRQALQAQAQAFDDQSLGKDRQVVWLGFDGSSYRIDSPIHTESLKKPDARATLIRTSIEQALRLPAGKPISGIVLITDGRTPQDTGPELTRQLQQLGVPIFTVPVGAAHPPVDLAISQADGPQRAFVGDTAPVSVSIDQLGGEPIDPSQIHVSLINIADGQLLDEANLSEALPGEPLKLAGKSEAVGTSRWQVRVQQLSPDGRTPVRELVMDNNVRTVEIEVIDRPIRVLYVEGYPRWEYRYLKNLLIREKSISASPYLISADRAFAQEGDVPITRLPSTAEEWDAYDVIIIGDVPASYFSVEQFTLLRDHVSIGGAGLMWIGGEANTPRRYAGTPLADLLPMRRPDDVARFGTPLSTFKIKPDSLARSLNVLDLRSLNRSTTGTDVWSVDLPPVRWVQNPGKLKPTAEVLAEAASLTDSEQHVPVVMRLRYGAGQSLYIGTDESWRWRYGRGEWYFEQYWVPLVRMLGRARIQADSQQAQLNISHRTVKALQPVVVELELTDASLINRGMPRIDVTVRSASDPTGPAADQLTLLPVEQNGSSTPGSARRAAYRAVWRPSAVGELLISVTDPVLADLGLVQTLRVTSPDDETANPRTDHARLQLLAEQTNGSVVALDELDRLIELAPNRARITATDIREPIWDSALSLIVLGVLLTLEWVFRRMIRLA